MLTQAKHIKIAHAAWMVAGFEFGGLLGALFGGWITDRFLRGRARWSRQREEQEQKHTNARAQCEHGAGKLDVT
jgi:hypothetical protein